jgi:hypothetical protein
MTEAEFERDCDAKIAELAEVVYQATDREAIRQAWGAQIEACDIAFDEAMKASAVDVATGVFYGVPGARELTYQEAMVESVRFAVGEQ